jgi:pilus assembly protein Flp/PilA
MEPSVLSNFLRPVRQLLRDEDGPTAVEYAVMLALIVVVCIGAITTLGSNAAATFTATDAALAPTDSGGGGSGGGTEDSSS